MPVSDIETNERLAEGTFSLPPNGRKTLGRLNIFYSEQRMLLISWEINGQKGYNHYLCGMPAFDFAQYQKWLKLLSQYD